MPKKADDNKRISPLTEKKIKTYGSQIKASKKYDKDNVDNVRVRVPKGWNEQMQNYVASSDKYTSVNAMICELIQREIPNIKSTKEIEKNN